MSLSIKTSQSSLEEFASELEDVTVNNNYGLKIAIMNRHWNGISISKNQLSIIYLSGMFDTKKKIYYF